MAEFACIYLAIGAVIWILLELGGHISFAMREFQLHQRRSASWISVILLISSFVFAWPLLIVLFIRWRKTKGA